MKRLIYILMMTLLVVANAAAQNDYVIDTVCQGALRTYRINGDPAATWEWNLQDVDSVDYNHKITSQGNFADTDTLGNPIWGSEIDVSWDVPIGTYELSVIDSMSYLSVLDSTTYHVCTNHELGKVIVIPPPVTNAGDDFIACASDSIVLNDASASVNSALKWNTFGDGTFSDSTTLHPTYYPGVTDLDSGYVTLSLTEIGQGGGCFDIDMITITLSNPELEVSKVDPLCFGDNSGTISVNASGGIEPYTYDWNGPDGYTANADSIYNLTPGQYYVTVTDAQGCTVQDSAEIIEPPQLTAIIDSFQNVSCFGGNDGMAHVTISGGTEPYIINWNTIPVQTTELATGLIAGEYIVEVTDSNLCVASDTVIITEPLAPLALSADSIDAKCGGKKLGSIELFVSGGTPFADSSYIYEWHDSTGIIATTKDIDNLDGEKFYWVYVTDSLGCVDSLKMFINEEKNIELTPTIDPILCYGDSGMLYVDVKHGKKPFYYKWYNYAGDTLRTFTTDNRTDSIKVPAGEYWVIVNDDFGCDEEAHFILEEPDELTAFVSPNPAEMCEDDTMQFNGGPNGGTGGYTHLWTGDGAMYLNANDIVNPAFSGAPADIYELIYTVTDSLGCFASDTASILVKPMVTPQLAAIDTLCQDDIPPSLPELDQNGILGSWSPATISTNVPGTYVYTFTPDPAFTECGLPDSVEVVVTPALIPVLDSIAALCLNETPPDLPVADLNGVSGTWSPAVISTDSVGIFNYAFTPDASYDCALTETIQVEILPPVVPVLAEIDPLCQFAVPPALPAADLNGVTGTWSPAAISTDSVGIFTYVFTPDASYDCPVADSIEVEILPLDIAEVAPIDTLCQFDVPPVLPDTDLNGITGFWSPNAISTDIPGTFEFIFTPDTSLYACGIPDTALVVIKPAVIPELDLISPLCFEDIPPVLPPTDINGVSGTWSPAVISTDSAGIFDYVFTPDASYDCALTDTIQIEILPPTIPVLASIEPVCQFAVPPALPTSDLNGVTGTWSPASINTDSVGLFTYVFTPDASYDCPVADSIEVEILPLDIAEVAPIDTLCQFDVPPVLPNVDVNGISGFWNPEEITTDVAGTFEFIFTPDTNLYDCGIPDTLTVTVIPSQKPEFDPMGPLCVGDVPPTLPAADINGMTGTWAPATINTSTAGTFDFIFTPDASYTCALRDTISVEIIDIVVPVVNDIPPICQDATPPALPSTDAYGIEGTWSPAVINTNTVGTFTYVFTPDASYICFETDSIEIEILPPTIPDLAAIDTLCQFETPPSLPAFDLNGVSGEWTPTSISTDVAGTFEFVFTPDASYPCAVPDTINVVVQPTIIPELDSIGPLCQFDAPPSLPATDINGVSGTWSPATINTDVAGEFEYIFTPDASYECSVPDTITIEILAPVLPLLADIAPLCQNSVPPALPASDLNGVTGTWSPDTINTSAVGLFTYVFTPDPSYLCAETDSIEIEILPPTVPELAQMGPFCQNSVPPALPDVDINGIAGTWEPAKINTDVAGVFEYVFTASDIYDCPESDTILIEITPLFIPEFDQIGPLCYGDTPPTLPTTDKNGMTGSWTPSVISTDSADVFEFIFTPDPGYACSVNDTMLIEILAPVIPQLANIPPICQDAVPPSLPTTDVNGVSGTWSPSVINTDSVGFYTFVFTPDPSYQCAEIDSIEVEILQPTVPEVADIGLLCQFSAPPALPDFDLNGYSGTWEPAVINTDSAGIFEFIFTVDDSYTCPESDTIFIKVTPMIDPEFEPIGPLCLNDTPPELPANDIQGVGGTWSPSTISTDSAGIFEYIFTPDASLDCAINDTILIEILAPVIPVLNDIPPVCLNAEPPLLPATDAFGVTGTWSPATISTDSVGVFEFTFTPDDSYICYEPRSISVEIIPLTVPEVEEIGPLCQFSIPPDLPVFDTNGYSGSWSPSVINTDSIGIFEYVFTVDDTYPCPESDTIYIEIVPSMVPQFDRIGPLCIGQIPPELPESDLAGITGTWEPSVISTDSIGKFDYIFTPDSTFECAIPVTIAIEITPGEIPVFVDLGPLCQYSIPPALPETSENGITGYWTPDTISTNVAGTFEYRFTPISGGCILADSAMITEVEVHAATRDTVELTICEPDLPYNWNGQLLESAGTYSDTLINAASCDSVVILNLFIDDITEMDYYVTSEESYTWNITNETYYNSGLYTDTTTNSNGCQHIDRLHLTIYSSEAVTRCESYTWPVNGVIYTQTGIYNYTDPATGNEHTLDLIISPKMTLEAIVTPISCYGEEDGAIDLTVRGGTPVFSYQWNYRGRQTQDISGLPGPADGDPLRLYSVLVTDALGCRASRSFIIYAKDPIVVALSPEDVSCFGGSDGSVTVTSISGGEPQYKYRWSNGATTKNLTGVEAGTYELTVTDSEGCTTVVSAVVNEPDELTLNLSKEDLDCYNVPGGGIEVIAQGGTQPYTSYAWTGPNGFTATGSQITNILAGEYFVTVTDNNECIAQTNTIVTEPTQILVDIEPDSAIICEDEQVQLTTTATGGNGSYTHLWSDAGAVYLSSDTVANPVFSGAPAGVFQLVYSAIDSLGCMGHDTITIEVEPIIRPQFSDVGPFCQFDPPVTLPTTDDNGVTGTWSPAVVSTDNAGISRYVFTPDSIYDCAKIKQITIEILPSVVPELDPIGPFCVGDIPPSLPDTDLNGIIGTWSQDTIDTSTPSEFEFIFTPDPSYDCAKTDTIVIEVLPIVPSALPPIEPICQYSEPPALPDTIEGVTGTWFPGTINTDHPDTLTFVFTPDPQFECSRIDSIQVIIDSLIVPQFDPIGPVCQFDTPPELPEANFNGVTGTWTPSVTQTDSAGIFPYIFEPEPGFHCAVTDTLWLEVKPWITPEFDPIGPLCVNSTPPELPSISNNGISGFWTPDTIGTTTIGTTDYIFTPDDSVMCAYRDTITISIEQNFKPVAGNDSAYTVQEFPVDIDILANDSDSAGMIDTTSFALVESPLHGTIMFDVSTGIVTYAPEIGYFGLDTFYYSIFDLGLPCEPLGDTAMVVVEIDEPNNPPVAVNDSFTVACKPLTENLLTNDYDPDGDLIEAIVYPVTEPMHGTVTINSNGSFSYMPDQGYTGVDSFRYQICDNGIPQLCDEALVWIMVLPDIDCDEVPDEPGEEDDDCALFIPDGFSPNGDGVHDFFQIFCIDKYPDAIMRIFDRAGNKLFEKQHYGNLKYWGSDEEAWWWGKSENKWIIGRDNLPAGNYLYVLELGNGEVRTGTVMIAY